MSPIRPIAHPLGISAPAAPQPAAPLTAPPPESGDTFALTPPSLPGYPGPVFFGTTPEPGPLDGSSPGPTPWTPGDLPPTPLGFGITNFNQQASDHLTQSADLRQARRAATVTHLKIETAQLPPGALVVLDQFLSVPSLGVPGCFAQVERLATHGDLVTRAARDTGYTGPILEKDLSGVHSAAVDDLAQRGREAENRWQTAHDPAEIRAALTDWASARRSQALRSQRDEIEVLTEGGVKNAVVNMSSGISAAKMAQEVFDQIPVGDDAYSTARKTQLFTQLNKAAGITLQDLVAGSANNWDRVRQTVQGQVQKSEDTPLYVGEKAGYDFAVKQLVDQNNTVVVAASNSGRAAWVSQPGAPDLTGAQVPEAILRNDLATPLTTVVGALKDGQIADYSSRFSGIHFYANGDVQNGEETAQGTSFAAPRVSAGLAALKEAHPNASRQQLQQMAQLQLSTDRIDDGYGSVPTLTHGFLLAD